MSIKIVHVCLASFYIDGYSYQENILPKYHKRLGFEVEIIASQMTFDENGVLKEKASGQRSYINEFGIKVTRIDYRGTFKATHRFRKYRGLFGVLSQANPDIIFLHGCQFGDMNSVVRYLQNRPDVKVFVDNHADYFNSGKNWFSKRILHHRLWKRSAHLIEPYTDIFWGVLPSRVAFLNQEYELPLKKCHLLMMGADDDEVERVCLPGTRELVRERLRIEQDSFVIVTGGKIDENKPQVLNLMMAFKQGLINDCSLLVFGPVAPVLKDKFDSILEGSEIHYIPWANASESYDLFAMADLVVFPGLHSVYWEQVAALGKPMIVHRIPGVNHLGTSGNVVYLDDVSSESLAAHVRAIAEDKQLYEEMVRIARARASDFRYSSIAKKSIGM